LNCEDLVTSQKMVSLFKRIQLYHIIKRRLTVEKGVYVHYKHGDLYQVLGTVLHAETQESLVLYQRLEQTTSPGPFVQPIERFQENVEYKNKSIPRFQRIIMLNIRWAAQLPHKGS